ncbi:PREDICTED: uncharacterized protein LOC109208620 [Nicotiana attenuata]|uniref:uncharacterized protein LOC109208620 n=1 Tax=Nicotiana attenuata TaxID=49451 RepID=UPI000904A2AF|nr:PREDICTED: uncharacterized protein LOC109208620 [Nicotiana attenuata]
MGLDAMNQSIAKNAADGSFMDKTFARITQILDKMAKHKKAWHSEETTGGIAYGTPSLNNMIKENQQRDQAIAGLATNVNVLTKMFTESQTKKMYVVENVQPTSNEDYEEANYVNNSQGGYQRQQYQGSGQQNQWRPNLQGQGNQQWRNNQGSSNQGNWSNNNNNFSNQSSNPYVRHFNEEYDRACRSGNVLQGENEQVVEVEDFEQEVKAQVEVPIVVEAKKVPEEFKIQEVNREEDKEKVKEMPKTLAPIPRPPPLFPQRLSRRVDYSKLEKFYDILKKLSVNIPFVEAFQQMPGFAKYLKDLITRKKTTKNEVVNVTHQVSSIIATTTIQKKEDPGAFTIPCTVGPRDFARALVILGIPSI